MTSITPFTGGERLSAPVPPLRLPRASTAGPTLFISRDRAHDVGRLLQREHSAAAYEVREAEHENADRSFDRGFVVTLHDRTGRVVLTA